MSDNAALLRHLIEQSTGILAECSPALKAYFKMLTTGEDPIPPEHAIKLVQDLQSRYIGVPKGFEDED